MTIRQAFNLYLKRSERCVCAGFGVVARIAPRLEPVGGGLLVLSDHTIKDELAKGRIVIDPLGDGAVQPASVDVHLDRKLRVFRNSRRPYIDLREDTSDLTEVVEIADDVPFILHPGEFVLASTFEHIELPEDLVARLEGKSSLGRIGLLIHSTAGYVDPGWKGTPDPGAEQRGEPSCHAVLQDEDRPAIVPAGSRRRWTTYTAPRPSAASTRVRRNRRRAGRTRTLACAGREGVVHCQNPTSPLHWIPDFGGICATLRRSAPNAGVPLILTFSRQGRRDILAPPVRFLCAGTAIEGEGHGD